MKTAVLPSMLLTLILLLPGVARAGSDSVKYWLPLCKPLISPATPDVKSAYHAGECLGMIETTAFFLQAATPGGLPFRACLPDNAITSQRLVGTVLGWIQTKPDLENLDFKVVTALALAATWPCKAPDKTGRSPPK
jgi:hypothetical protein